MTDTPRQKDTSLLDAMKTISESRSWDSVSGGHTMTLKPGDHAPLHQHMTDQGYKVQTLYRSGAETSTNKYSHKDGHTAHIVRSPEGSFLSTDSDKTKAHVSKVMGVTDTKVTEPAKMTKHIKAKQTEGTRHEALVAENKRLKAAKSVLSES